MLQQVCQLLGSLFCQTQQNSPLRTSPEHFLHAKAVLLLLPVKFQPGKNEKILKPVVNQSPTIKCENMMKLGYSKEDTSTAVGVAKPSAHGQATTCIQDTHAHYCME